MNFLLCTDLDRTLLPNGSHKESSNARQYFRRLVSHPEITLVYVTGRDRHLMIDALDHYGLPLPRYAITDVGTHIYERVQRELVIWEKWNDILSQHWPDTMRSRVESMLAKDLRLYLQEPEKQNRFKISYYSDLEADQTELENEIRSLLSRLDLTANIIASRDEMKQIGLIDIVPINATKRLAIEFLIKDQGLSMNHSVFAGDSGNDLAVVESDIKTIIVANASADIKQQAQNISKNINQEDSLYIAKGKYMDMNGCYSAGILEGFAHYFPQTIDWMLT